MQWFRSAVNTFKFDKRLRAAIRPRFSADLLVSLVGFIPFAVSVWYLGLVSSFRDQVLVTIIYAMIPLLLLFSASAISPSRWRPSNFVLMMVGAVIVACVAHAIAEFAPAALRNVFAILIVAAPFLFLLAVLFRRWIIAVALLPAMVIALWYLVVAALPEGERLNLFALPLFIVLVASTPWACFAWLSLKAAEHWRKAVKWGPATEALAMLVLFLPTIVLSILVPIDLDAGKVWQTVSITIVGVLFSGVVSVPLRQFLLDLGNLPPNDRWEGR